MCMKVGCNLRATHAPKICVPATGWPIELHQPMSAVFGLELCAGHAREFDVNAALSPEMRDVFETLASSNDRRAPDFSRAFVTAIRLDSVEYKKYKSGSK